MSSSQLATEALAGRGEDGIAGVCRELDRILREFVTEAKLIAADDGGKGSGRGGRRGCEESWQASHDCREILRWWR